MTASKATAAATSRAAVYLLGRQHPDGYWRGDFDTGASATVPDVLLRHHLEIEEPAALGRSAATIRAGQQPGGCWSLYEAGPGDLGLTAAAYVALRVAGDPPTAPHLQRAAEWVRARRHREGRPHPRRLLAGGMRAGAVDRCAGPSGRAGVAAGVEPAEHHPPGAGWPGAAGRPRGVAGGPPHPTGCRRSWPWTRSPRSPLDFGSPQRESPASRAAACSRHGGRQNAGSLSGRADFLVPLTRSYDLLTLDDLR